MLIYVFLILLILITLCELMITVKAVKEARQNIRIKKTQ